MTDEMRVELQRAKVDMVMEKTQGKGFGQIVGDAMDAYSSTEDLHDLHYDPVHRPSHYASGDIECIDAIEAQMTPEEFKGYLRGNVAKYVWRFTHKGGEESLKKAQWYLNKLIERVGNGN